jgi:hypothetical protein
MNLAGYKINIWKISTFAIYANYWNRNQFLILILIYNSTWNKIPRINLTKEIKDLENKNYTALMKEDKKNKDIQFMDWNDQYY